MAVLISYHILLSTLWQLSNVTGVAVSSPGGSCIKTVYRGLARDVINDITAVAAILEVFFGAAHDVLMEITLENGRK
jgi:hypothetical protein